MTGQCHIELDPSQRLIRMTLSGFFTLEDVRSFDRQRQSATVELGCGLNRHLTLCDVIACELSTPDVAEALQRAIGNPVFRSRKCAMLVQGALARLQARRVVQRADVRMFDRIDEAEAWLLAEDRATSYAA